MVIALLLFWALESSRGPRPRPREVRLIHPPFPGFYFFFFLFLFSVLESFFPSCYCCFLLFLALPPRLHPRLRDSLD